MKKVLSFIVFALFCLMATAQVSKTINVSMAGNLSTLLTDTEKNTITNLTVTGNIDYRDFIFKVMKKLKVLDISGVVIDEYKEVYSWGEIVHPANELPENSFGNSNSEFKNTTIQEVMLPSNLTSIKENAFSYCIALKSITIPNTVKSIDRQVFWECSALTSINISNSVTSIGNNAFYGTAITSIMIPNSLTSISDGLFSNCKALKDVTIPNSVTSIGNEAFGGCSAITAINIPNSVTSIGSWAFSGCSALTVLTIPNTVISIGNGVLGGTAITSFTFPNSITVIPNGMFSSCKLLTSISIPNHITEIGDNAFSASGLESITIPNSVTKIGKTSFRECTNLQEVNFGKNTTSIGFMAFYLCNNLKFIYIPQITPPLIDQYTFDGVNKISCKLYVPKAALSVYKSTDFWKEFSDVNEILETYDVTVHAGIGGAVTFNNSIIPNNSSVQVYFGKNCSFSILPESGYQIETLTFDGINVINQLSNNQYTTPSIKKNSTLEVTFSKIKYLLSIKSAESGSADLVCVYGDILSFSFTSSLGWKINSIIYNGTNVTNSLINGLYTISGITGNSTLNISFESSSSGVSENIKNNIKVYSNQSEIIIDGANLGEVITIFDMTGKQLKSQKSIGERIVMPVSNSGIYIVKTADRSFKVVI